MMDNLYNKSRQNLNDNSNFNIPGLINSSNQSLINLNKYPPNPPFWMNMLNRQRSDIIDSSTNLYNNMAHIHSSSFNNLLKPNFSSNSLNLTSQQFENKKFPKPPSSTNNTKENLFYPHQMDFFNPPLPGEGIPHNITNIDSSTSLNMMNKKRKRVNDEEKENNNKIIKDSEETEKMDKNSNQNLKTRGSKYRGVSRNGNQWQALIMIDKKKRYVGSYSKEEDAARAYDKVAIQNHGLLKAKTNFTYTKEEVDKLLSSPQLLKLS